MKTQDNQKISLINWIITHRTLFLIIALLTFTIIVLVPLMYIIPYNENKKVSFGDNTYVDKFTSLSKEVDLDKNESLIYNDNYVKINIELSDYYINEFDDQTGYYNFIISHTKSNDVTDLKVEVVLKYDWVDIKSDVKTLSLNPKTTERININRVRNSPLWFVDIKKPNIYIKVSYKVSVGKFPENRVGYAKSTLNNLLSKDELKKLND